MFSSSLHFALLHYALLHVAPSSSPWTRSRHSTFLQRQPPVPPPKDIAHGTQVARVGAVLFFPALWRDLDCNIRIPWVYVNTLTRQQEPQDYAQQHHVASEIRTFTSALYKLTETRLQTELALHGWMCVTLPAARLLKSPGTLTSPDSTRPGLTTAGLAVAGVLNSLSGRMNLSILSNRPSPRHFECIKRRIT